ncbi:MAG: bacterial Ig-like domain-containing protein, partial [Lachnospiraceae bacterium]|nr:bacterial Ig-like domain-containing protein [Lachnospiraceae bacterium]
MKKRFFALLMVLVMLMSLVPSTALAASTGESNAVTAVTYGEKAAEAKTGAIFVGTDVHSSTSSLTSILSTVSGDGIAYTVLGGDTQDSGSGKLSDYTSAITEVLTSLSTEDCYFTYGNHDQGMSTAGTNGFLDSANDGAVDLGTAWLWGISYDEMNSSSSASTAAAAFSSWVNGLASDDHRAIIIVSHIPMHDRRNDNPGGATWLSVINAAAENKDILFFWGHNHTNWDTKNDTPYQYVAPGGTLLPEGGSSTTIKFTYALAGFIGKSATGTWDGSTVKVEDDTITIKQYSSGALSDTKAISRKDVMDVPDGTLLSVTLDTAYVKTVYTTDDTELDLSGLIVTANYWKAASQVVTDYTITHNVNFKKAGTYNVTISYTQDTGAKAVNTVSESFGVTVKKASSTITIGENSTVYVLTDSLEAGRNYLIVGSGSAGDSNALTHSAGTVGADSVTINAATEAINAVYINPEDVESTSIWTPTKVNSYVKLKNGDYFLQIQGSGSTLSAVLEETYSDNRWSFANNVLLEEYTGSGNSTRERWVKYASGTFSGASTSSATIYLYVETEISTAIIYEFTVDSISARQNEDGSVDNRVIICGLTENGTTVTPTSITYTIVADEDGIINGISGSGEITFNSNVTGTATVDVSYTYGTGDDAITDSRQITVKVLEYSEHHWSNTPHWDWVGDNTNGYTAATATFLCDDEGCEETWEIPAQITVTENVPDCQTPSETFYTATVTGPNGNVYQDVKEVDHSHDFIAYVQVDKITLGRDYIIVNTNAAGSAYALKNNNGTVATSAVTINAQDEEMDSAYILAENIDTGIIWTATAHTNSSFSQYARLINNGYAVYPDRNATGASASNPALSLTNDLTSQSGAQYTRYWEYDAPGVLAGKSTNPDSTVYYMVYESNTFKASTSASQIYIFEKQSVKLGFGPHTWVYDGMTYGDGNKTAYGSYHCSLCGNTVTAPAVVDEQDMDENCERPYRTQYTATISANNAPDGVEREDDSKYTPKQKPVTTTDNNATVYVLVSSVSNNKDYLIVNVNSEQNGAHALGRNGTAIGDASVNVLSGSVNGNNQIYIASVDSTAVWTCNSSGNYYTFKNGSYYLRPRTGNNTYSLNVNTSTNYNAWSIGTNRLYYSSRYLSFGTSTTWTMSRTASNVYLFEKVTGATIQKTEYVDAPALGHTFENNNHTAAKAATCTEDGNVEYWTCDRCGKHFASNSDTDPEAEALATVVVAATGHAWGEPTYVWAADHSSVTATRVCAHDPSHTETETAQATMTAETPATCSIKGSQTWTSDNFNNSAFTVQTETVELQIDANAHDWGTPTYVWAENHSSVTATRICAHDPSHTETETVGATCTSLILATCTDEGSQTWVSDDFQNEAFAAKTETIVLPIEEEAHDWTFVDFTWMKTEDGYAAVANYVCGHDETHT